MPIQYQIHKLSPKDLAQVLMFPTAATVFGPEMLLAVETSTIKNQAKDFPGHRDGGLRSLTHLEERLRLGLGVSVDGFRQLL